jgi:hypothetical protein
MITQIVEVTLGLVAIVTMVVLAIAIWSDLH